jgi:NAD-dependent deacetylase
MPVVIPEEAKDFIRMSFKRANVVCLTGAGVSSESGIPTFRGKGGLWEKYAPEIYAYPEGLISLLREKPRDLANFIVDFYAVLVKARPNPAHISLAVLEREGILNSVITQNIDNLHRLAGNRNVIELHGNAFRIRCMGCQKKISLEKDRMQEFIQLLNKNLQSRLKILKILSRYFPRCDCGSRFRVDIVLFGEMLPEDELSAAFKQLEHCDVLLLIGTSLVVYPAAGLPVYAKEKKAKLIEINNEPSALSHICDYRIQGTASEVMPQILNLLES